MRGQVYPCMQAQLAELLSTACEDVELPVSKSAASSPKDLKRTLLICSAYGMCVHFLIHVSSLLKREDNEAHYGSQGSTD